jgi:hypothetical protein
MTLTTPVTASSDYLSSNLAGEEVLLSLDKGIYYGLNEAGARIWALISSEPITGTQICDRLEAEYDVDRDTLEADVLDLLTKLEKEGIVQAAEKDARMRSANENA